MISGSPWFPMVPHGSINGTDFRSRWIAAKPLAMRRCGCRACRVRRELLSCCSFIQMGMGQYLWKYHYYSGLFTSILTQLFWCEQKGYYWFWPIPRLFSDRFFFFRFFLAGELGQKFCMSSVRLSTGFFSDSGPRGCWAWTVFWLHLWPLPLLSQGGR